MKNGNNLHLFAKKNRLRTRTLLYLDCGGMTIPGQDWKDEVVS